MNKDYLSVSKLFRIRSMCCSKVGSLEMMSNIIQTLNFILIWFETYQTNEIKVSPKGLDLENPTFLVGSKVDVLKWI